ncbi:MAG TPA: ATP-binding protein [Thermoanaerobaculia bacterium]|nr:ATP-binding protein [Thermoanaerobaculia bacterium]
MNFTRRRHTAVMMSAQLELSIPESEEFPRLGDLVTLGETFPSTATVNEVADKLFTNPALDAFAIVDGRRPIGLITRQKFLFTVFRRFGWELYGKKAILEITDRHPLILDKEERLDVALDRALHRKPEDVYDDIVIVDSSGQYLGLLSVKRMVVQQSHALANILVQKDLTDSRFREYQRLSEIKSQFLANVTHELRSPVNAIVELADLIKTSADRGYVDQLKDRLSLLLGSASNLRSVITSMLDLSKIEAGKMQLIEEEFDLIPMLEELVDTTRVLIANKPVQVELATEVSGLKLVTDPVKLRQILTNLLSNATKFTEQGRIRLVQRVDRGRLMLEVSDTGIGIRPADLERLFEAFTQLEDTATRRHSGTGLGLTITRQLLTLLDGSIQVESVYGIGSRFIVDLPCKGATHDQ